jgi:hypothetical protein
MERLDPRPTETAASRERPYVQRAVFSNLLD